MKNPKIKEYLKTLNFGLKDYEKTRSKYEHYKPEEFQQFIRDNKRDINQYLTLDLSEEVRYKINEKLRYMDYLKLDKKRFIRMFKTMINGLTYDNNKNFISSIWGLTNLNNNTLKNFTILFYLRFYEQINQIMKNILTQYVEEYPKKAVVQKMGGA